MSKPVVRYLISNLAALDLLTPREKQCLSMRLGINGYDRQHTLKEVAQVLGFKSTDGSRQIESKALKKLRHPSRDGGVIELKWNHDKNCSLPKLCDLMNPYCYFCKKIRPCLERHIFIIYEENAKAYSSCKKCRKKYEGKIYDSQC